MERLKRLEGLMMDMAVGKNLVRFWFQIFYVPEISTCRTSAVDEDLKAIVETDPSQTTSE